MLRVVRLECSLTAVPVPCYERLGRPQLREDGVILRSGADRNRTDDLLVANQALSRLSYGPRVLLLYHLSG
jgi:hypothetical protein